MTTILNRNAGRGHGPGVACAARVPCLRLARSFDLVVYVKPWGMGGTPMIDRKAGVPRVRGTRTPCLAAALSAYLMTAPRKGRGVLLSGFASEVLAPCSITSRPDKRLFLGARALFFIARNEGSSMVSDNYTSIHRMKYD